jgi:hypothetical protein
VLDDMAVIDIILRCQTPVGVIAGVKAVRKEPFK